MSTKTTGIGLLASLAAVAAFAFHSPVQAQEQGLRAGWQPWLGCWQSMAAEEEGQGILCLIAEGQDVEMLTIVDGEVEFSEPLVADGGTYEFERDDCWGTESARFSEDRRRLYTASLVTCDGGVSRRSTGIISMPTPDEWIDVRAIETNGATTAWSKRYLRTSPNVLSPPGLDIPVARPNPFALHGGISHATSPITIDDVIDASRNVNVNAVTGWLAEVAPRFQGLSVEDLIRLVDAGVATAVIDMVVELSFPEHFALNEETDGDDTYRSYGHGNRHHHGYWQPGPTVVVIEDNPVRPTGGTGVVTGDPNPPVKSGRPGQVVAGKGYRKPESTTSSGCSSGSKSSSSSCKGSTGRKAVRRGGK